MSLASMYTQNALCILQRWRVLGRPVKPGDDPGNVVWPHQGRVASPYSSGISLEPSPSRGAVVSPSPSGRCSITLSVQRPNL